MNSIHVARICHEANRVYCESLGDMSQPHWEDAPDWQRNSAIKGVEFHLKIFTETGVWPRPSASHESWLKQKEEEGWKYGPVKDPDKKEHPCFVSYDELPLEQRTKDSLFGSIIQAVISV